MAIQTLKELKKARDRGDEATYASLREKFEDPRWLDEYYQHFGYGYYKGRELKELIPNVKLNFYSFHVMVILGIHFLVLSVIALWLSLKNRWGGSKMAAVGCTDYPADALDRQPGRMAGGRDGEATVGGL